jgi:hypothetical protein
MPPDRLPDRLSSAEVAIVLRRAAELDQRAETQGMLEGFDPAAVEEAAREVGLSATAVRQALAELRAGTLDERGGSVTSWPSPQVIIETRVVAGAPEDVHRAVAKFLRKQTFQLRRHHGQRALYRPRRDLVAKLRRTVDVGGALRLHGVHAVIVDVCPVDVTPATGSSTPAGSTNGGLGDDSDAVAGGEASGGAATAAAGDVTSVVRIEADLGPQRRRLVTGAATSGVVVGGATGAAGAMVGEIALVIAAPPVGIAVGGGMLVLGARGFRRRRFELSEVLAGFLDRLG